MLFVFYPGFRRRGLRLRLRPPRSRLHPRATGCHPLRGFKNSLRLLGAAKFEPTEWAAASRPGWSDKVAEPLLREKYDQNPERPVRA